MAAGGSTPGPWGLSQEGVLGWGRGQGCLGRGKGAPGDAEVLGGARQEVSRGTQVGDKDLERCLRETCQGVSPGVLSRGGDNMSRSDGDSPSLPGAVREGAQCRQPHDRAAPRFGGECHVLGARCPVEKGGCVPGERGTGRC